MSKSNSLPSLSPRADEWMSVAVDCLEFLPDELVVEVSRGLAAGVDDLLQCKRLLYQVLVSHYRQMQRPPLLNNCLFDIHSGISELLVNGKLELALEALQLSLTLQDSHSREELRRLLRFMATAAKPQEVKLNKENGGKEVFLQRHCIQRKALEGQGGLDGSVHDGQPP
ncbi:DEP domain-containing protein 7 [Xenoophorus captivus]|uniref:DEP domain-containing protein 7 n=1 Tax=Xenoophorus captivus TaxID=1517983 RepID=A0ABV0REN8_9TELE